MPGNLDIYLVLTSRRTPPKAIKPTATSIDNMRFSLGLGSRDCENRIVSIVVTMIAYRIM
jgi:hypothetical protein